MDPERCYVLSLIKRDDEPGDVALARFWDTGWVDLTEIKHPMRRRMVSLIQDNASRDIPTGVTMMAQFTGVDKAVLQEAVDNVDPAGYRLYFEQMTETHRTTAVRRVADTVTKADGITSSQMLDELQTELAKISVADEDTRIVSLPQAGRDFMAWMEKKQADMKAGVPRLAFHSPEVNRMVPYLFNGTMILLTAKTKVGKTSWSLDWYDSQLRRGFKGLYFHFEDPPEVMGLRRTALLMGRDAPRNGNVSTGIPFRRMLTEVLRDDEMELCNRLNADAEKWTGNGHQVWCVGWTMAQVARVWQRMWMRGEADFVVVDYLNKAHVVSQDIRYLGIFESRARDAEIVKNTAEKLGTVAMLVQQEGDDGTPFQTRQGAQKCQVRISLQRERLGEEHGRRLSPEGRISVMVANLGESGDINAEFLSDWMMWEESDRVVRS